MQKNIFEVDNFHDFKELAHQWAVEGIKSHFSRDWEEERRAQYYPSTLFMKFMDMVLVYRDYYKGYLMRDTAEQKIREIEVRFNETIQLTKSAMDVFFIWQWLQQISECIGGPLQDHEEFDALCLVNPLYEKGLIPYGTYELFITEERSYGPIKCYMKDDTFHFSHIDCSVDQAGNLPREPEDEMYYTIYRVVNRLLTQLKTTQVFV
ncbi:hypothetical protein ACFSCX_05900 [Bacillus salitolerans]|uniref:Uncharacterized protein n=1 Tax=Bacillus salitolerans TaxID=1437434 RepID=A0ABW4LLP1_9BACI